jgi:hypothetical protein
VSAKGRSGLSRALCSAFQPIELTMVIDHSTIRS